MHQPRNSRVGRSSYGRRTKPLPYNCGIGGRKVATLHGTLSARKPCMLLVGDSNARNIVRPQIVRPSPTSPFVLSAMSLPGGKVSDGTRQILQGTFFRNVSVVLLGLGTNDILSCGSFDNNAFQRDVVELVNATQSMYPLAKVVVCSILPQWGDSSLRVPIANSTLVRVSREKRVHYLPMKIDDEDVCWHDDIHLSDFGLTQYMQRLEDGVRAFLQGPLLTSSLFPVLGYPRMTTMTATQPKQEMLQDQTSAETKHIPVVSHVIHDQDAGIPMGVKLKPMDLSRAAKLLTDPHSSQLFERHVHALRRVAGRYSLGYPMKDLVQVFKILNVCADRVAEYPCYVEPMCLLLQICGLPFLKEKMSDETIYAQIAIESVSQLGYLMRVSNSQVRSALIDALVSFYCKPPSFADRLQDFRPTSHKYNMMIVEMSSVSETLIKSLAISGDDLQIKLKILRVLQKLSSRSVANCDQMLKSDAAYFICCCMNFPDPSGYLLFSSVEILWNLLELGGAEVQQQLGNLECINSLKSAFKTLMVSGCSNYEQQLRNDLLVIATLVAQNAGAPIVESGFAKQLILFATFSEVKSHNPLVKNLKLSQSHEDFELKKLLINMLQLLSRDKAALQLLSDGKVLLSLFHYVKPNESKKLPREWSVAQFEELQLHALSALSNLSVMLVNDYMTCQGNTRLLLLLEWCISQDPFLGHGNSFHGAGGRGSKKAQTRYCLRLLRTMVSMGNELVMQDLCDQGIISQILNILQQPLPDSDIDIQCDMLHILSTLCENDIHRKELFGNQGIDVLVNFMKIKPEKVASGLGHHKLMLATVDATWCCAVGCFSTEDFFLEKEGVFYLIDLLQTCPRTMHNLILGCLLELCENPKTIAHIYTWRGERDVTAPHLLIHLWREEEKKIGSIRDKKGAISDVTSPLAGSVQREHSVIPQSSTSPSLAIVDVSENLRAKVYALFARLGFSDLPGLTTDDYITLAIIEKYMDFKLGEVWCEIAAELPTEGVRPTTPDMEALETITRAAVERAKGVAMLQGELLEAEEQQNLHDEKQLYVELKENHKQKEREIAQWKDYVQRTSNHDYLVTCKKQQDKSIESSRAKPRYREQAKKVSKTRHETMLRNLNTTTFQGRNLTVENIIPELTEGEMPGQNTSKTRVVV